MNPPQVIASTNGVLPVQNGPKSPVLLTAKSSLSKSLSAKAPALKASAMRSAVPRPELQRGLSRPMPSVSMRPAVPPSMMVRPPLPPGASVLPGAPGIPGASIIPGAPVVPGAPLRQTSFRPTASARPRLIRKASIQSQILPNASMRPEFPGAVAFKPVDPATKQTTKFPANSPPGTGKSIGVPAQSSRRAAPPPAGRPNLSRLPTVNFAPPVASPSLRPAIRPQASVLQSNLPMQPKSIIRPTVTAVPPSSLFPRPAIGTAPVNNGHLRPQSPPLSESLLKTPPRPQPSPSQPQPSPSQPQPSPSRPQSPPTVPLSSPPTGFKVSQTAKNAVLPKLPPPQPAAPKGPSSNSLVHLQRPPGESVAKSLPVTAMNVGSPFLKTLPSEGLVTRKTIPGPEVDGLLADGSGKNAAKSTQVTPSIQIPTSQHAGKKMSPAAKQTSPEAVGAKRITPTDTFDSTEPSTESTHSLLSKGSDGPPEDSLPVDLPHIDLWLKPYHRTKRVQHKKKMALMWTSRLPSIYSRLGEGADDVDPLLYGIFHR